MDERIKQMQEDALKQKQRIEKLHLLQMIWIRLLILKLTVLLNRNLIVFVKKITRVSVEN